MKIIGALKTLDINLKIKPSTTILPLWRIRVPKDMQESLPKVKKVQERYRFYRIHHYFPTPVTVTDRGILVDGYITFLLARMLGHKEVPVRVEVEV